ncbi:MAG TPA: hypothetical protein VKA34_19685 [Balneolales bacterium]|nr:hypothetical protein [Balneolales bacterium]
MCNLYNLFESGLRPVKHYYHFIIFCNTIGQNNKTNGNVEILDTLHLIIMEKQIDSKNDQTTIINFIIVTPKYKGTCHDMSLHQ